MISEAIGAIILAAGQATRMGVPKLLLPWKHGSVIESVIDLTLAAKLNPVVIVTGAFSSQIRNTLSHYSDQICFIHNDKFAEYEMLYSIKLGLSQLAGKCEAAMLFLGDQPHISSETVSDMISIYSHQGIGILIPSHRMKRGHPILIQHQFFYEILDMPDNSNLKVFLANHEKDIQYLVTQDDSVLEDMDTPSGYQQLKKKHLDQG